MSDFIKKNSKDLSQIKLDFSTDMSPTNVTLINILYIHILYIYMHVNVCIYISSWGNLELQAVDSTRLIKLSH